MMLLARRALRRAADAAAARPFPIPAGAAAALRDGLAWRCPGGCRAIGDFLDALMPANVLEAAASDAILPVILFMTLFALAPLACAEARATG